MAETMTKESILDYFKEGKRLPEEPKAEKKKGLAEGLKKFWEEVKAGKKPYPKPWSKKKAEKEKKVEEKKEEPKSEKKEEKETEKMKEKIEKVATPEEILKVEEKKEEKEEKPSKGLGFEFKDKFDINWILFVVAVIGMIYFFIKMRKTETQPTQVVQPEPKEEYFEYDAGGGLKVKLPIK